MGEPDHAFITRRRLLAGVGSAAAAHRAGQSDAAATSEATPAPDAPADHFDQAEAAALGALGKTLVPSAREAGIVRFVDEQLGRASPMLTLKYLDYAGEYADFYRQGLTALDAQAMARRGRRFADLAAADQTAIVGAVAGGTAEGWSGPPAPLFYFALRGDAVDVVYGTHEGFARLGVPAMPHIVPPQEW